MRCFVAIGIDPAIRARLEAAVDRLRRATETAVAAGARITWTRPDGWHVTVKFLGELAEERIASVLAALSATVGGFRRFDMTLAGLDAFPPGRAARALTVGVIDDGESARLAENVNTTLAALDFARDEKPYVGHLTLARLRDRAGARAVREAIAEKNGEVFGTTTIESVGLYESILEPTGALYHDLARLALDART